MSNHHAITPVALTIAGSDPSGGAGIQADLKTFYALGVHGTSVITAITAQNTRTVQAVHAVPTTHIHLQLDAIFTDFPVSAVKTGMLGNAATVRQVAHDMRYRSPVWLIVDPVMMAGSGAKLLTEDGVTTLMEALIPLADVLTPNRIEAETLVGHPLHADHDFDLAGETLLGMGARAVLLKGGHGPGSPVVDRWYDAQGRMDICHQRLPYEGHGTGCTLAAAIAAALAQGHSPRTAARQATDYVHKALSRSSLFANPSVAILRH